MGKKELHLLRKFVPLVFLSCLLLSTPVLGENRTFEKEYAHQAGDEDSKNSSRAIALREVKRLVLEELGAYLESTTEVKDFQLTRDEVTTLTAGVVNTEIIAETWNGSVYIMKARITADPDDVARSIDRLRKDSEKTKELEEIRKSLGALMAENEKLKKDLTQATDGSKTATLAAYRKNIKALNAFEWFEKGYARDASGDCGGAINAYNKALRVDPEFAPAYNNRGKCYTKLGSYRKAIKDFTMAISLNPALAQAHYNRANARNGLQQFREALQDFSRAIELDQGFTTAYNNRGNAHCRLGEFREALQDFSRAIELEPGYSPAYYNRSNTYDRLGNQRQAIDDLISAARQGHQKAGNALRVRGVSW
jgi:tetratricopeptide (TPR) repeat protein